MASGVPKVLTKLACKTGAGPINWFPGHMASATRSIRERLRLIDLIVEVRDARIPCTSANKDFQDFLSRKRRLIVCNKADLTNPNIVHKWKDYFEAQGESIVFVNAHNKDSIKLLFQEIRNGLKSIMDRPTLLIMVVGIPNVGKSAIINGLHAMSHTEHEKLKKATVGPLPGVTLNLQGFKIHSKPSIFILDTPGVLVPNISDLDTGLKLALTGAIKDSVVGEERLCRYLLAFLNSRQAPLKWKKSIEEARAKEEEARKLLVEKGKPKTLLELKRQAYLAQKRLSNPKPERVSDHNKDSVILLVRETLLNTFSSFSGDLEDENDMESLVEIQMHELRKVLKVSIELGDKGWEILGRKILNLYRIGRLGNYSLDALSGEAEKQIGHTKV
ncbi:hypothetical protein KP509_09G078800 [Ceratopteris richardii]|uniref:CP-type G domain-containing protein n=1 Tax=Ceratopteris richardii TaxID=49495 RepID=A0A8T2U8D6_CERRI|nr:hypothetical protein KP509_09G078800 [Ceratopteris richardii]